MAKGIRKTWWIKGPHGVVSVSRGAGITQDFEVIDPEVEAVIFTGTKKDAMAFALGDNGEIIEVVG